MAGAKVSVRRGQDAAVRLRPGAGLGGIRRPVPRQEAHAVARGPAVRCRATTLGSQL